MLLGFLRTVGLLRFRLGRVGYNCRFGVWDVGACPFKSMLLVRVRAISCVGSSQWYQINEIHSDQGDMYTPSAARVLLCGKNCGTGGDLRTYGMCSCPPAVKL